MNNTSAPIIEVWNSDDESEIDYTVRPSTEKVERTVWNNSRRVNHKIFTNKVTHPHPKRSFVPQAVLTKSGKLSTAGAAVNTVRPVNTANTKEVNTVRSVNTAALKPIINHPRTKTNDFKRGYSQSSSPFKRHLANKNSIINTNVNTTRVKYTTAKDRAVGNPQQKEYKEKRVIDNGCSRHMTGNKCYLDEYEDYDGGFVSFGDGKGRIFGKGKIKTGSLDFDDVYFCKELKYNLFSVSQICDKKNNVLFIDTECLVLSSNFKLLDESQGIKRGFSMARTPQQNGVAERKNRTLIEAARTMLVDSNLPTTFWIEAVNTACYVLNRVLVIKPHNKTPYELICPKDCEGDAGMKPIKVDENEALDKSRKHDQEARSQSERLNQKEMQTEHTNSSNDINNVSTPVSTAGPSFDTDVPSTPVNTAGPCVSTANESEEQLFE
ncbi:ribonuclease H-like domain-containing protein [Tanacetum coccineum]